MPTPTHSLAAGMRIRLRSEDFLITKAFNPSYREVSLKEKQRLESHVVECEGITELVRGRRYTFDLAIDKDYEVVAPERTVLYADEAPGYRHTRLYLESRLRTADVRGSRIALAHKAALNVADYQYVPAVKALAQPFARILIADAVGLGKTAEVGILLTELMRRGRARRVLVLALKSVLSQFQQELWARFAIPLVRLDSDGVSELRAELPANKNPFDYYDKTIVSIDTLKNNGRFQHYLERTRWDVVVVDECHNVANLGSQRGGLAELLARRCDNLVFTSATPHNGDNAKFANLMRMLEPTIVSETDEFEVKRLDRHIVRRTKRDLRGAVSENFRDRQLHRETATLLPAEVDFLAWQQNFKTDEIAMHQGTQHQSTRLDALFSIGLLKAYLSSPQAAMVSIEARLRENQRQIDKENADKPYSERKRHRLEREMERLPEGLALVREVLAKAEDAKLRKLFEVLEREGWRGTAKSQRIVLFAERVDTLEYLEGAIAQHFGLKTVGASAERGHSIVEGVARFDGSLTDVAQQRVIDDFGRERSATRLLLASDAGSQGVNLHYYCHRMINYDLPWSLITLEQRNGRIDRYGQTERPHIHYLIAESDLAGLDTDLRIIKRIQEKEEAAYEKIGDAKSVGAVTALYDAEAEVDFTTKAIAEGAVDFLDAPATAALTFDDLLAQAQAQSADERDGDPEENLEPIDLPSLYRDDEDFYRETVDYLLAEGALEHNEVRWLDEEILEVENTKALRKLLFGLPVEATRGVRHFQLSLKPATVQRAIARARKSDGDWADTTLLYDGHPLARYWMTKVQTRIPRGQAPVARLRTLPAGEAYYLLYGQSTNALGTSLLSEFFVVGVNAAGKFFDAPLTFDEFWQKHELQDFDNVWSTRTTDAETLARLQALLPEVVGKAQTLYLNFMQGNLKQKMDKHEADYQKQLQLWFGDAFEAEESGVGLPAKPTRAQVMQRAYRRGLERYKKYTEMRAGTHLQVLGVVWG